MKKKLLQKIKLHITDYFYVEGISLDSLEIHILEYNKASTMYGISNYNAKINYRHKQRFCKQYGYTMKYANEVAMYIGMQGRNIYWLHEQMVARYSYDKGYRTLVNTINGVTVMDCITKRQIGSILSICLS